MGFGCLRCELETGIVFCLWVCESGDVYVGVSVGVGVCVCVYV